jgi:protein-S-isoprenylcysteine O-methyltransferase Ste14
MMVYLALAVSAWGNVSGFFGHPARIGLVASSALLVVIACFSGTSAFSGGRRESAGSRWIFAPLFFLALAFAYLPPYADRHDFWTLDGDLVRYVGLVVFLIGSTIRLVSMFVLGKRFSVLVAIQPNHQLKKDGVYRLIRHPSYTGALLALVGSVLVYRSGIGLVLVLVVLLVVIWRIKDEERFLESEFGAEYSEYRRKTWRLLPFLY